MPQTPPNQRGPASSAFNTSQYSGSARGSQPPEGGILLRIPGWVPPGHVEGKEHAHEGAEPAASLRVDWVGALVVSHFAGRRKHSAAIIEQWEQPLLCWLR